MTHEELIIRKTIDFCAQVAADGICTEEKLYGRQAIEELKKNYSAVSDYILDHINNPNPSERD